MGVVFGHVPEYIDGMADGKEMLRKWRDGVIALEDFQKYIIESSVYLNERVFGMLTVYDISLPSCAILM